MSGKISYVNAPRKREVRSLFLTGNQESNLVTLGGPNIDIALNEAKKYGFQTVLSFETDMETFVDQQNKLGNRDDIRLVFGNILDFPTNPGRVYDMDFCETIDKYQHILYRFKDVKYIFTFCLRNSGGTAPTIHKFMTGMGMHYYRIERIFGTSELSIICGEKTLRAITYKEHPGAPMISITNIINNQYE